MQLTIDIPTVRTPLKDIIIVNTEPARKGLKSELEKKHRPYLRQYKPFWIPICCEWCQHVGEAMWHCNNSKSSHYWLNVHPFNVCSKWVLNVGLVMYLQNKIWEQTIPKTPT